MRAHERYVAALSHDFGTPISALQMAAKQLEAHLGASQRSEAEEAVVRPLFAGMEAALEVMRALNTNPNPNPNPIPNPDPDPDPNPNSNPNPNPIRTRTSTAAQR